MAKSALFDLQKVVGLHRVDPKWSDYVHMHPDFYTATISQHYYWTQLRDDIRTCKKVCNTGQKTRKNLKYGKLPAKEAEYITWERLLVDLIIPYKIRR